MFRLNLFVLRYSPISAARPGRMMIIRHAKSRHTRTSDGERAQAPEGFPRLGKARPGGDHQSYGGAAPAFS